jgi:hypothetical protein
MPRRIYIQVGDLSLEAELNDTRVAQRILDALPISALCNRWGDEIYFMIPVEAYEDGGQEVMKAGDLAYWPPGKAFCIFFGPTPASKGGEIRAASAVQFIGRVLDSVEGLKNIQDGAEIVLKE